MSRSQLSFLRVIRKRATAIFTAVLPSLRPEKKKCSQEVLRPQATVGEILLCLSLHISDTFVVMCLSIAKLRLRNIDIDTLLF